MKPVAAITAAPLAGQVRTPASTDGRFLEALRIGEAETARDTRPVSVTLSVLHPVLLEESGRFDRERRDREARRRGSEMLAVLGRMQLGLLGTPGGQAAAEAAAEAIGLLQSCPEAADPGLGGAVRAIAVRLAVELARSGRN